MVSQDLTTDGRKLPENILWSIVGYSDLKPNTK